MTTTTIAPTTRTRVGTDVKLGGLGGDLDRFPGAPETAEFAFAILDDVVGAGLDGLRFRTLDELAPTLDAGFLREVGQRATELGLYVDMGLGKVNPYMTAELPRVRDLGDGSYLAGMERMVEACAANGWTETWTAVGGYKPYPGVFFTDRFRTDAPWPDQLDATVRFLNRLAPALRANGVHLNIETHEEIATSELLRIIEEVGEDVIGVCLDPANLLVRGEPPREAIARVAPYVRSTQLRDAALFRLPEGGIARFIAPCGLGVVDWPETLRLLLSHRPDLDLTIEGIGGIRAEMPVLPEDPTWRAASPYADDAMVAELYRLTDEHEARATAGAAEALADLRRPVPDRAAHARFVAACADHLRTTLKEISL
jgi:sugar phosphate isomerase/epimerase